MKNTHKFKFKLGDTVVLIKNPLSKGQVTGIQNCQSGDRYYIQWHDGDWHKNDWRWEEDLKLDE